MINALLYIVFGNEGRKEKNKEEISFSPFDCTREKKSE